MNLVPETLPMPRLAQRQDRVSLRLSPQSKQKLERAAADLDKTLTEFVVNVALAKAESVVREHGSIALTAAGWSRFQDMPLPPPAPNERLHRALA